MHPREIAYWTLGGLSIVSAGLTLYAWPVLWLVAMAVLFFPETSKGAPRP